VSALLAVLSTAAFVTATLSAVLGMGGGIVLMGVLTVALPASMVVPVHGVVQLCSNSTRTIIFLRHVQWSIFATFAPFLLLGVGAATQLYTGSKLPWFKPLIGLFILTFLFWRKVKPTLRTPPLWVYAPLGAVAGFLTMFVGATGPFIAPFFLRDDLGKEEVIATKAVCQSVGHALKIPAFLYIGFDYAGEGPLLGWMVAAVILGTFTGKKLLHYLDARWFERLFLALLTLMALHLIGTWIASLLTAGTLS
jgi:uncharacterized membrane protein YfcA